jgi:hypothetical protein
VRVNSHPNVTPFSRPIIAREFTGIALAETFGRLFEAEPFLVICHFPKPGNRLSPALC